MAIVKTIKGLKPKFGKHCYLADGAVIIGEVTLGDDVTIWPCAVLRGDVHYIKIGNRSNIQDNSCVHTLNGKATVVIGEDVTIGHSVTLHGCTIQDGALVGMGATVLDHAVVGKGAIVAAGALVLSNTHIPDGELWGGVPAKFIKRVDPEQAQALNKTYAAHYIEYSDWYREADRAPQNTQIVLNGEDFK